MGRRFGGKISAVGVKGCTVCLSLGEEGRAATHSTVDHRWAPPDLKTIQSKMEGNGNTPNISNRMEHKMLTNMDGEVVKGSPKRRTEIGHQRITCSKAEIQIAQDGPKLVENLVETSVKRVEKDKVSPGVKMIPR